MRSKDYKKYLNRYVKENKGRGYSLKTIEKALITYGFEPKFARRLVIEHKIKNDLSIAAPLILVLLISVSAIFFMKPAIVGYTTTAR